MTLDQLIIFKSQIIILIKSGRGAVPRFLYGILKLKHFKQITRNQCEFDWSQTVKYIKMALTTVALNSCLFRHHVINKLQIFHV